MECTPGILGALLVQLTIRHAKEPGGVIGTMDYRARTIVHAREPGGVIGTMACGARQGTWGRYWYK